jgi:hypothetical protein
MAYTVFVFTFSELFSMAHSGMTAQQFKDTEARAKTMSTDSLEYCIQDCKQAADAAASLPYIGISSKSEGYYLDEMMTYSDELRRRKNKSNK